MINRPRQQQLSLIPKLYSTDSTELKDKPVYMRFSFPGGSEWYAFEFDGIDTFFGFVILNNDFELSEIGYFSLNELSDIKLHGCIEVQCDPFWKVRPANQVDKICYARGWSMPKISIVP